MNSRIALDRYVYEDIYPAFKAATDEKEITAALNRNLINQLMRRNLVLTGADPAGVADIGCGPCDTLIQYLTGVDFAPGFIVRATDFLPEYADAERGECLRVLGAAQAAQTIKINDFSARAGDAFGGNLIELLSGPHDAAARRHAFRIVFASHVMYHADGSSAVERLLADVATNILATDGICILYHAANKPGTFQEFRARHGSRADAHSESDTGAVTIDDPPAQIAKACDALGLQMCEAEFTAWLRFGRLGRQEWQAFKNPHSYDALADAHPQTCEDLKRLYFMVQRAPLEFAADTSATGLIAFMDEVRTVIDSNGGMLPMGERVQVFSRKDSSPALSGAISDALSASIPLGS